MASRLDVQDAFRRGIRGAALQPEADGLAEEPAAFAAGANEQALLELTRLPGLTDPYAAFETGRALKRIVELFDRAKAPDRIGREFLANLAGAVVVDHMRGSRQPWGAVDTVDMFVELYARVLGDRPAELDALRRAVMDYAVSDQAGRESAKREPWYRRGAG